MSPSTGLGMTASTRSTRWARSSVARALNLPGMAKAITRPCTVALLARAAFTTPWGVTQSSSCRRSSRPTSDSPSRAPWRRRPAWRARLARRRPQARAATEPSASLPAGCAWSRSSSSGAEHHEAVVARLRGPNLARPAEDLPDVRAPLVAREHLELLGGRLEADDRVGAEVAEPHDVLLVHVHGVRARALAGQPPRLPRLRPRIVHAHVAGVPLADPDPALAVGPHAPRALILRRRLDDGRRARVEIDARDVAAGQRGVVDVALGRRRDPVGAAAARRVPDLHVAGRGVEAAVHAALAREPDAPALVERRGVEVGPLARLRQRPAPDLARLRIDAHDRVRAALGHPRRAVGADDHAVRRRPLAEWDQLDLAARGIEAPQLAVALRRVPDDAVRAHRHVVRRAAARGQGVGPRRDLGPDG